MSVKKDKNSQSVNKNKKTQSFVASGKTRDSFAKSDRFDKHNRFDKTERFDKSDRFTETDEKENSVRNRDGSGKYTKRSQTRKTTEKQTYRQVFGSDHSTKINDKTSSKKTVNKTGIARELKTRDSSKSMRTDKVFDVIVVGGGYSGLVATAKLIGSGVKSVLVIDGQARVGKKLLATGNGRGNVSNENVTTENYHGEKAFAEYALKNYGVDSVKDFYSKLGVILTNENGRLYPCSLQANALLDALRYATEKADFLTGKKVLKVEKNEKGIFEVITDDEKYFSKYVVLAFGGAAGQNMGTDGKSFEIVKALGHSVTELKPSLVQMKTETEFCKGLKGIKVDSRVTLYDGKNLDKPIKTVRGDLLFTDYGVSGNTIFELSAYLEKCAEPYILAEFLPDESDEELLEAIKTRKEIYGDKPAETLLCGIVNNKIAEKIMRRIAAEKLVSDLDDECVTKAKTAIKRYIGRVLGTCGFDLAQVTHGGVRCEEVRGKTFESKIISSLFLIGELLNVDGDCGGYNLQWAFSSACCAASNIVRKLNGTENND